MTKKENLTLRVSGASLFYRARGKGPLLLIIPGGPGDADSADGLCAQLEDRFTVVTYDRRGLSRSKIDSATAPATIADHSDDAHRLLAALTAEPVLVFGSSMGALIGLDLVSRHAGQVRILVAHEPPVWDLLPDAERERVVRDIEEIVDTFRREGVNAAFQKFANFAGIDIADREPDAILQPPSPQTLANMSFFFTNDVLSANNFRFGLSEQNALETGITRLVLAGGSSSRQGPPYLCALALAEKLGTKLAEFPDGHAGWMFRPKGFAAKLIEVLSAR